MRIGKYIATAKKKNFYALQKLLLKDSDFVLSELSLEFNLKEEDKEKGEKLYDSFIMLMWSILPTIADHKGNLKEYIGHLRKDIDSIINTDDDYDYKMNIVLNDNPSVKDIKERENIFRVHRVVKRLIIADFKERNNIENSRYENLVSILNNSRYENYYGGYYQEAGETIPFFFLVVINNDSLYRAFYTIQYDELEGQSTIRHDFKDAQGFILRYNSNYKVYRTAIKFKNGDIIQNRESRHKDGIEYENFLYKFLKEKYPNVDFTGEKSTYERDWDKYVNLFI